MWFRRNKYDDFEQWCVAIKELPLGEGLTAREFRKHDGLKPADRREQFHNAVMGQINANEEQPGHISIDHHDMQHAQFNIDLSSKGDRESITPSTRPDLLDVSTATLGELRMVSANVRRLRLGQNTSSVDLTNCCIEMLSLRGPSVKELRLRDCWIGHLESV